MLMKGIIVLLVVLAVLSSVFLFGNNLHCVSVSSPDCPQLCKSYHIDCSGALANTQRCQNGGDVCRAPSIEEYKGMLSDSLSKVLDKINKIKK